MKKAILLLLSIFLFSCNKKEKINVGDLPFFKFDKIDYYRTDISREALDSIGMKQEKSRKERALMQVLVQNIPVNTMDTLFINNMEILGFEKSVIDSSQYKRISNLFSLHDTANIDASACAVIFRDVLVFRKKDKVIGVAKICFDCGQNHIVGARYDSSKFGQSGEYEELMEILKVKAYR